MKQQALMIELLDDCVFSASAATEGGHAGIDRVPGSALLGAAAADLYSKLPRDVAWLVFHSGRLRFGDGLPQRGASVGYPVPFVWHHGKLERPDDDSRLQSPRLFNFLWMDSIPRDAEGQIQSKQLRGGYVHGDGFWSKPQHSLRLKTAINTSTGRAAESQLFGYDSLFRGQYFLAEIQADNEVGDELFEQVVQSLLGERLLGRSRSAEYGRVRIHRAEGPERAMEATRDDCLVLWVLSDLALQDEWGQPCLEPMPVAFGLADCEWDAGRSFLRHRRYSPWNAARQGYERERLVLAAGSVIAFRCQGGFKDGDLNHLQQGVGLYREAGLGRLWVNPPLLMSDQPVFPPGDAPELEAKPQRPDHPLLDWLEAQDSGWKDRADDWARKVADQYHDAVQRARRAAGVVGKVQFGPSRSQWGRVLEAARHSQGKILFGELFEGSSAVVKDKAEGWNVEIPPVGSGEWSSLADWLKVQLTADNLHPREYAHRARRLAHQVRNDINRRGV